MSSNHYYEASICSEGNGKPWHPFVSFLFDGEMDSWIARNEDYREDYDELARFAESRLNRKLSPAEDKELLEAVVWAGLKSQGAEL